MRMGLKGRKTEFRVKLKIAFTYVEQTGTTVFTDRLIIYNHTATAQN